jgi:hypothetical protein
LSTLRKQGAGIHARYETEAGKKEISKVPRIQKYNVPFSLGIC